MASLFWRRLRGDHTTSSEGASGAIYSCMGMSFLSFFLLFNLFRFHLSIHASPFSISCITRFNRVVHDEDGLNREMPPRPPRSINADVYIAFFAAMFPNTQFLLFFVVPMPAWLFAGGIFAVSPLSTLLFLPRPSLYLSLLHYPHLSSLPGPSDTQYDLFGALYRPNSTTDSAGHLGGIVAGLGAAMLFRKGRFPRGPRMR